MRESLIDSELLMRLLDSHLVIEAEVRDFRALRYRAGVEHPEALLRCAQGRWPGQKP